MPLCVFPVSNRETASRERLIFPFTQKNHFNNFFLMFPLAFSLAPILTRKLRPFHRHVPVRKVTTNSQKLRVPYRVSLMHASQANGDRHDPVRMTLRRFLPGVTSAKAATKLQPFRSPRFANVTPLTPKSSNRHQKAHLAIHQIQGWVPVMIVMLAGNSPYNTRGP